VAVVVVNPGAAVGRDPDATGTSPGTREGSPAARAGVGRAAGHDDVADVEEKEGAAGANA